MPFQNWCKEFDKYLLEHSEVSKVSTLMGCFWPKYIMFGLKKYRRGIILDTGEWCKISKGIDLSVQNWHEEFNEFWPKHSKISKICPFVGCLWPKYIIFELTKHRWVMFDDTENWCKIWRKTDMCFKNDMRNLATFHQSTQKPQSWDFGVMGSYVSWQWLMMSNSKGNWFVSSKLAWGIWWILTRALKYLKH